MPDTFALTIITIVIVTIIGAFIKGRSKDKCLNDFHGDIVTLEETSGKIIWGRLRVENSGIELCYKQAHQDQQGHLETSFILYKHEFPLIQAIIRFHNKLDEAGKKKRADELRKTYHPSTTRRICRKVHNFFKTVRDSIIDITNLLIGRVKRISPAGAILVSQDKYVSRIKQELITTMGTSYEPLLEKHIGKKVVLELMRGDKIYEYPGVLKDYTAEFIEVMDVDYQLSDEPPQKADLVVLRKYGVIRHLGE